MTRLYRLLFVLVLGLLFAGCDLEELGQAKSDIKKDAQTKPAEKAAETVKTAAPTVKVNKGSLKNEITLKGVFEAEEMTEISLHPETWSGFTVIKAVEHGTVVKKGDQLVQLDMERIDQAIHELEMDQAIAALSLKQADEELPLYEKATPIDMELAERTKLHADEDLKRWYEFDRPQMVRMVDFLLRNARNYLEYSKEELKQLEKMYRSGDIREETEEIIVRRQRHQVESQEFMVKNNEQRRDLLMKMDLPRLEQSAKDSAVRAALTLERNKITLPVTLNQKKLSLERQKYDRQKSQEKMKKLRHDHEIMALKAPVDGVVYYGKCTRGQWSSSGRLQRGSNLMSEDVFMTIVKPQALFVRATVDEKDLPSIKTGMAGKCIAVAYPDVNLAAKVKEVSTVPLSSGSFEAKLDFKPNEATTIVAGMGCSVKLVIYSKKDALTLPSGTVFTDEDDDDKRYVYLAGKDDKATKTYITAGKTIGGKTEILGGLKAGDEVRLEKPSEDKK